MARRNRALGSIPSLLFFLIVLLVFCFMGMSGVLSTNAMRYLFRIFLYISLGEAWNLLSGFSGLTSLGQQLYIGLAGYSVAAATSLYCLPFWAGLILGAAIGVATAYLLSFILFRMNGMYFSIATWVAAESMSMFFFSWKFVNQGGGMTISISPYPAIGQLYFMAVLLCAATLTAITLLLRSRMGLALMAIHDDGDAAASIGVDLRRTRLMAFLISALIFALTGGLFFINQGTIYPDSGFDISWTISAVFIVIIGGSGTVAGPIAGAVIYVLLHEYLANYPGWSNLILGVITIVMILFFPKGIVGTLQQKLGIELFSVRRRA